MELGKSKLLPDLHCLNCGKLIDGATSVDGDYLPDAGDATICIYCGHLMVFDLTVRKPNDAELEELAGDKRILAIQKARGFLKEGGKP